MSLKRRNVVRSVTGMLIKMVLVNRVVNASSAKQDLGMSDDGQRLGCFVDNN